MLTIVIKLTGSILMPPGSKGREVSLQNSSVLLIISLEYQSGTCSTVSCLSPVPSTACSQMHLGLTPSTGRTHRHLCLALTYTQTPPVLLPL